MSLAGTVSNAAARVPIRLRLTAVFALAMAVVIIGLGAFLTVRLDHNLTRAIDDGLRLRAEQIATSGADEQLGAGGTLTERGDGVAQIVTTDGTVLEATAGLTTSLLSRAQLAAATRSDDSTIEREHMPVGDDPSRILAVPAKRDGRTVLVVVGASTDSRREARDELVGLLLVGGPLALLIASALGYWVAGAALRPVDRMRREAERVTAGDPHRLPVPPARDELQALGTTLNTMLDRLSDAFTRERAFVADASHELRTPLAVLKAELEVALRPQRTQAEQVDALRSASEETDRLTRLADDLLVLTRADQRGIPVRREPVDLDALLLRTRDRFAAKAAGLGVQLEIDAGDRPAERSVVGDPDRLQQAVDNLVDNALRHAASRVLLRATPATSGDAAVIAVLDDGPGFPDEFLPRAFERFAQADASRRASGAGLGLAIVQVIAVAHGGAARAENLASGGARVEIELPRAAD